MNKTITPPRKKNFSFVFGPVRSGRLGLSLGLDLLGGRICSFDCLYCEVGKTDALTCARKPYVPARRVLAELADFVRGGYSPFEIVTLGGLGEPCLNSELAEIIAGVKTLCPETPVAVLTNGAHLHDPAVRRELGAADVVLPSLDTLVDAEFRRINRPHADIGLDGIRQGLLDFRSEFSGRLFLETLLMADVNDTTENLERLADFVPTLGPDRVDVVTMTRPGTWPEGRAASAGTLARFRQALSAVVDGEAPRDGAASGHGPSGLKAAEGADAYTSAILSSLRRRPQTAGQLAEALGADAAVISDCLERLVREEQIFAKQAFGDVFYSGKRRR